jgi:hypothetical protein
MNIEVIHMAAPSDSAKPPNGFPLQSYFQNETSFPPQTNRAEVFISINGSKPVPLPTSVSLFIGVPARADPAEYGITRSQQKDLEEGSAQGPEEKTDSARPFKDEVNVREDQPKPRRFLLCPRIQSPLCRTITGIAVSIIFISVAIVLQNGGGAWLLHSFNR